MDIQCLVCNEVKDETFFHKQSKSKTGRQFRCKVCDKKWHAERYIRDKDKISKQTKEWKLKNKDRAEKKGIEWKARNPEKVKVYQKASNLRKRFGIDYKQYDAMYRNQNGVCAICGNEESFVHHASKKIAMLAVDHCHATGVIRGLLCRSCNIAIGHMKDSPDILRSALAYLEKYIGK